MAVMQLLENGYRIAHHQTQGLTKRCKRVLEMV